MVWPWRMVCPADGSQVNVLAPDPDDPAKPDEPPEPADDPGITTVYEPASPSVPFSCVCSVSEPRVTASVPVAYPLLLAAGLGELNTPAAPAPPSAAAATTTTASTRAQPRRRRRYPVTAETLAPPAPSAWPPLRAGNIWPGGCSSPPGVTGSPACSRASVLLIAMSPFFAVGQVRPARLLISWLVRRCRTFDRSSGRPGALGLKVAAAPCSGAGVRQPRGLRVSSV